MDYRETAEDLLKAGLIKKCPIDEKAILNLIDTISIFLKQNSPQLEIDFKKRTEKP